MKNLFFFIIAFFIMTTSNAQAWLEVEAPAGSDGLRVRVNETETKLRVFENGAVSLNSNWGAPLANTTYIAGNVGIQTPPENESSATALKVLGNSSIAGDITIPADNDYTYNAPKTKYMSVSYTAFIGSETDEEALVFDTNSKPYRFFRGGSSSFGYADAPINLPTGATITEVTVWLYDNLNTDLIRVRLYETPYGGSNSSIANMELSNAFMSTSIQEVSDDTVNHVVDNFNNSYFLRLSCGHSDTEELRIYGARIEYTVSAVD